MSKMSGNKERMTCGNPQSLFTCASHVVGTIITKVALDIFDKYIKIENINAEKGKDVESLITRTAEFFDTLIPKPLHDIVMQHSLQCLPYDIVWNLRFSKYNLNFLDIVLRSHATRFDITEWPYEVHYMLYKSLQRLTDLQYLKLKGTDENLIYVTRAVKDMKMLEVFECRYCCDDIVKALSNNCQLRKLSIYSSWDVTDSSSPYILSLQNLNYLNILNCRLSIESCIQILGGLPHLVTVYSDHMHSYLAQINDDKVQLPYEAVHYFCYTEKDMANLIKYCPLITKLDILFPKVYDLSGLAKLNHIKSLRVDSYLNYIEYNKLKIFLESKGHQLIELQLVDIQDKDSRTVNEIKSLCPNLKCFSLERDGYVPL